MADVLRDLEAYQKFDEMMCVLRSAVREAQAESRRQGVPNVYSLGDQIYYELPNGEYTPTCPWAEESSTVDQDSGRDDRTT